MQAFRRRAALCRAVDAARLGSYSCEPLEQRLLLTANGDPVIVFTEPPRRPPLRSTRRRWDLPKPVTLV
jgi:hypothetical protein